MNRTPLPLLLALASLTACAQSPVVPKADAGATAAPAAVKVPASALTSPLLYQFLLGEIAGQRGDLALAKEAYVDLAEKTRDPRVVRRAGEIATYARDASTSARMAKLWVELEPQTVRARQSLAGILISSDRLDEARPHLEALLRMGDRSAAESFPQLHGMLARAKDKMAALALIKDLAAGYPGLPEASMAVAQMALAAGQQAQALSALDEALRVRPDWEAAALLKGQALTRSGDEPVLAYWQSFLDAHPGATRLRQAYAKELAKAGRYEAARAEFDTLIRGAPTNPDLYFAIGLLAMQMNDLEAAGRYLDQALAHGFADDDLIRAYQGQIMEGRKDYPAALAWYLKVQPSEHYFSARLKAAVVHGKLGQVEAGRALLKELETPTEATQTQRYQAEAQLLREANRLAEAYEVLSRALTSLPESGDLLYDRAMISERLGRLAESEADLRKLIALDPEHAHAYNALGYTLVDRTDRLAEGIELLDKALKLSPDDPFILDSMGWALFKSGKLSEAVDYLRRAYAQRDDPEIAAHLGEALWATGQRDEARKVWQGSLKDYPDNDVLKDTITRFSR